jgi:hypothetical protein
MGPIRPLTRWIKGSYPRDKSSSDVLFATDHNLILSFTVRGAILLALIWITDVELIKEVLIFLPVSSSVFEPLYAHVYVATRFHNAKVNSRDGRVYTAVSSECSSTELRDSQ